LEVALQVFIELRHNDAVAARRPPAGVLGDMVMGKPEPIQVTDQAEQVAELVARLPFGLRTEQPLHFTDIHGYDSATLAPGYLCSGTPDRLPPFALWPALPASDYYGGSDAPEVSLADCGPFRFTGASHVHLNGLCEEV
jgi:hypothetical protein